MKKAARNIISGRLMYAFCGAFVCAALFAAAF